MKSEQPTNLHHTVRDKLASYVFTYAKEGIIIADNDTTILDVNDAFTQVTGYTRHEALGQKTSLLKSGKHDKNFYENMWHQLLSEGYYSGEVYNKKSNGELYAQELKIIATHIDEPEDNYFIAYFSDISEYKRQLKHIEFIAKHDTLTRLPNRAHLMEHMHYTLNQARNHQSKVAVVYLDLDGFKEINDTHGHEAGDQLLKSIAKRLEAAVDMHDMIARIGGDEFVIVHRNVIDIQGYKKQIQNLLGVLNQAVHYKELQFKITASIGISFFSASNDVDSETLLRQADQAMYRAKLAGKNMFHIFDVQEDSELRSYFSNIDRVKEALENEEFLLYYQPKVNIRNGDIVGFEALLRWNHPDDGILGPDTFLPAILEDPILIKLGRWVLKRALMQLSTWNEMGHYLVVSINISSNEMHHPKFLEYLFDLLDSFDNVAPQQLQIEILESSALLDIDAVSSIIQACKTRGIGVAIDDFGTGYSSLNYLKKLPSDVLKIDKSFVMDMLNNVHDLSILDAVVGLSTAFNMRVLAEGVETQEHAHMLLRFGCDFAQGYFICMPLPHDEVIVWMQNYTHDATLGTIKRLNHKNLPIAYAATEHRNWIQAVKNYIAGVSTSLPPMNSRQCRFGKWLHSSGDIDAQMFETIDALHEKIHAEVEHTIKRFNEGTLTPKERKCEALDGYKKELVGLLEALIDTNTL